MNDYLAFGKSTERRIAIDNFFKGLNVSADESVLAPNTASLSYNFNFTSGVLCDGFGVENHEFFQADKNISAFWRFNRGVEQLLMFADQTGGVYYVDNLGQVNRLENVQINGKIYAQNYNLYGEDVILICSDSCDMVVWNGFDTPYFVASSPKVKSFSAHNSRLLAIDSAKNLLRYSTDLDPTNWNETPSEGGYICLSGKGKLFKVISFLNYAFLFHEHGISRISFSANTPIVLDMFVFGGSIFASTAVVVGDRIIFLCSDGLYAFDGLDTKRILPNLNGIFCATSEESACAESACAECFDGKYYLAFRLNPNCLDGEIVGCESGDFVNNGLLIYDPTNGDYCLNRGMDIGGFCVFNGGLAVLSGQKLGKIVKKSTYFGADLQKVWRSVFSDLNSENMKILRRICLDFCGEGRLIVNADGIERQYDFAQNVRINLRGRKFSFAFKSSSPNVKISRPVLVLSE